jgi:hypothetical protein
MASMVFPDRVHAQVRIWKEQTRTVSIAGVRESMSHSSWL